MDGGYTNIGGVLPQAAGSGSILCQPPQSSSGSVVDLAGQPGGNLGNNFCFPQTTSRFKSSLK